MVGGCWPVLLTDLVNRSGVETHPFLISCVGEVDGWYRVMVCDYRQNPAAFPIHKGWGEYNQLLGSSGDMF